ncbi:PIN domain-containing protein [Sphingomonas sp. NCPPB 2930]
MICFFDTNILLYTIDAADPARQEQAIDCFARAAADHQVALSTQVLQEFYSISTRKLRPPLSPQEAQHQLRQLSAFEVLHMTPQAILAACDLAQEHRLSWWDALILEAALRARADVLYTEDGQHGRRFGHLKVVNPFLEPA